MKRNYLPWMSLGVLIVLSGAAWLTSNGSRLDGSTSGAAGKTANLAADEQHFVTPAQLAEASAGTRQSVAFSAATASTGEATSWQQLSASRPLVVVFIRDGCPCSVKFEPIFHRLQSMLHPRIGFVGVIDADLETARRFVEANHVPYPVLADADKSLIHLFHAQNAAYVALVDSEGRVDRLWPGCSAEMMRDLNARAAKLAGIREPAFDASDMPGPLTTGCPF
jgi:peroxiredoxin